MKTRGTFNSTLDVRWVDGRTWQLLTPFDFASEALERVIRVPAGFVTDFASIPRFLWSVLPPTGPYGKAAVIHDDLYRFPEMTVPRVSRRDADRVLWEGMTVLGVAWVVKVLIYVNVRLFGGWVKAAINGRD